MYIYVFEHTQKETREFVVPDVKNASVHTTPLCLIVFYPNGATKDDWVILPGDTILFSDNVDKQVKATPLKLRQRPA